MEIGARCFSICYISNYISVFSRHLYVCVCALCVLAVYKKYHWKYIAWAWNIRAYSWWINFEKLLFKSFIWHLFFCAWMNCIVFIYYSFYIENVSQANRISVLNSTKLFIIYWIFPINFSDCIIYSTSIQCIKETLKTTATTIKPIVNCETFSFTPLVGSVGDFLYSFCFF